MYVFALAYLGPEKVYRGYLEDGGKGCDFLINFKKWGKTMSIKTLDPLMTDGKKKVTHT